MPEIKEHKRITDFEKACYIADKLRNVAGVRRIEPEEILGKCTKTGELDWYYWGLRDVIDSYEKAFLGRR